MRLLFDEQLSPRLVDLLNDVFPGAAHVHELGLGNTDDRRVFHHARDHGYTIVTKDGDFADLAVTLGSPPQVVWLRLGNCATTAVASLLRSQVATLAEFARDAGTSVLALADASRPG